MGRYFVKVGRGVADYSKVPKGMTSSQARGFAKHSWMKGRYKVIEAPTANKAIVKAYPKRKGMTAYIKRTQKDNFGLGGFGAFRY